MKKGTFSFILMLAGIVLLFASLIGSAYYGRILERGMIEVILIASIIACFVIGIGIIIGALALYLSDIEESDVDNYFSDETGNGYNLKALYKKYRETKKYSTWQSKLLNDYNPTDKNDKSKKPTTVDMQHSLKMIKRRISLADTVLTTIVAPAEIGIVAIVFDSDEPGGLFGAVILSVVICILFTISLRSTHKIRNFVNDVADELNIPMDIDS